MLLIYYVGYSLCHSSCNNQLDLERMDERGHGTEWTMRGGEVSVGRVLEPMIRST